MPVWGIFGRGDNIVNPNQVELVRKMPRGRGIVFERSRHYPMLDESERFYQVLRDFLALPVG